MMGFPGESCGHSGDPQSDGNCNETRDRIESPRSDWMANFGEDGDSDHARFSATNAIPDGDSEGAAADVSSCERDLLLLSSLGVNESRRDESVGGGVADSESA
mmetsp:Transcript_128333/g.227344  ORF Transcript_128333/g.227344 Transcript_128333/m.227344 type:complete len:103 (+) Transcript_128333:353-661(+)